MAPPLPAQARALSYALRRSESDRALVEGIAYLALDPPEDGSALPSGEAALRIDTYRTWMRRATLEAFAHRFLEHGRAIDSDHDHGVIGTLVESYLTRAGDPEYPADVWVTRVKVHDPETLARLDSGELTGFSIEFLPGAMVERTLQVEGVGKLRTAEIVDPLPLFLSLVERPAIRQPFTAVERREDLGRVTRLLSCELPSGRHEEPMDEKTTKGEQPTTSEARTEQTTAEQSTAPQGEVAVLPKPVPPVPQRRTVDTRWAALLPGELLSRAAPERRAEEMDWTDFSAVWADLGPGIVADRTVWAAIWLFESVVYEIEYRFGRTPEAFDKVAAATRALAEVIAGVATALAAETPTEGRSAEQRAGKKISAARLEKIKAACSAAGTASSTLSELITEVEGEPEEEGEGERSATSDGERSDKPSAELLADLSAKLADAQAQAEQASRARTEGEAALAGVRTELDKARAELSAQTTARETAEKRVAELEARRPPQRAREPQGSPEGDAPTEKRSPFRGVLFRHQDQDE